VDKAIQQIRQAAEQLAAEQAQWASTAQRLEGLVTDINTALRGADGDAAMAEHGRERGNGGGGAVQILSHWTPRAGARVGGSS
jgi:uncharacterized protein YukE